jgi:hypothetical protein
VRGREIRDALYLCMSLIRSNQRCAHFNQKRKARPPYSASLFNKKRDAHTSSASPIASPGPKKIMDCAFGSAESDLVASPVTACCFSPMRLCLPFQPSRETHVASCLRSSHGTSERDRRWASHTSERLAHHELPWLRHRFTLALLQIPNDDLFTHPVLILLIQVHILTVSWSTLISSRLGTRASIHVGEQAKLILPVQMI